MHGSFLLVEHGIGRRLVKGFNANHLSVSVLNGLDKEIIRPLPEEIVEISKILVELPVLSCLDLSVTNQMLKEPTRDARNTPAVYRQQPITGSQYGHSTGCYVSPPSDKSHLQRKHPRFFGKIVFGSARKNADIVTVANGAQDLGYDTIEFQ